MKNILSSFLLIFLISCGSSKQLNNENPTKHKEPGNFSFAIMQDGKVFKNITFKQGDNMEVVSFVTEEGTPIKWKDGEMVAYQDKNAFYRYASSNILMNQLNKTKGEFAIRKLRGAINVYKYTHTISHETKSVNPNLGDIYGYVKNNSLYAFFFIEKNNDGKLVSLEDDYNGYKNLEKMVNDSPIALEMLNRITYSKKDKKVNGGINEFFKVIQVYDNAVKEEKGLFD